jgi:Ca2+-dependent lipid-binding protein
LLHQIAQNHELRDATRTEFERFMILAREETARMSAEVKKLFALSMEAAAKLEALDQEEAALMAAANIRAPNPSAAADSVAAAASGASHVRANVLTRSLTTARLYGRHAIPQLQLIKRPPTSRCSGAAR